MDDETADLRAQLAEARTDKKFADMLGEVRIGFAGIEAKIGTLEGRIEGKIGTLEGRIEGKIGTLDGKISALDGRLSALEQSVAGIKPTIILTGLAVAALMIGVLTYGQAWFGIGVSTRDIMRATVAEYNLQHQTPAPK
jgi:hypothetical protein